MGKRRYSDDDRAAALCALDLHAGNASRAAKALGIPRVTLLQWRDGRVPATVADLRNGKKADLSAKLEAIAHRCADLIPEKLEGASLRDLVGALHIAVDKMRILRGDPTVITETRQLSDTELRERLLSHYRAAGLGEEDARRLVERAYEESP